MCERIFENFKNVICYAQLRKTKFGSGTRKTLNFGLSTYRVHSGSRPDLHARTEGSTLMGRVGRSSKMSFNIRHTLWPYTTCIHLLIYEIKIVTNILMGFKLWCQFGGGVTPYSKLPYSREFSIIWFQKLADIIDKLLSSIWWDGWDRPSKVSFKVLHTLWEYRTCILYTCIQNKNCRQHSYVF